MAGAQGPFLVAVLLLVSPGIHCSSPPPACPESCTCQRAPLLNCSSSGLSLVPQHIHDSVTELDLSHNLLGSVTLPRPHRNLRNIWLGNNSVTHLSLCIDIDLGERSVGGRHPRRLGPRSRRRCVSWAPTLQLLSVERNQLVQLPEGLEGSASLWVLQLSFNRISTLSPGDLSHLRQLKELHLQHNLITSLHPQMFQELDQLRVLDLSFNMLTSLHPLTYLSLRNIGSNVRLAGNRWQCDCSVRSLARRMTYDSSIGLQAWGMVCAFPTTLSGKDLLQLEEDDLNCFGTENSPELHRDVTVYSGSGILLSCSKQDSLWWTPSGQASVSEPQASLFISDVTERDTGLYVCMSEEHEVVSVFNLQISRIGRARRKTRSLPRTSRQVIPQDTPNRIGQGRNQRVTKSDLALAVCLSVLFTFLIAFILGVLARPFIDVHCIKTTNSKSSTATNSSAEERQYENEAYSNGEEPEERVTHRERRVKFGAVNFREDINVEYLNTVASSNQESITNDAVIECEVSRTEEDEHTAGDSRSENSSRPEDNQRHGRDLSGIDARCTHTVEVEHISDPAEREDRRSLSSCSDSSLSDREFKKDQMTQGDLTTPKYLQLAEESVHQRPVFSTSKSPEVPPISLVGSAENPGFSSETSADWAPHTNNPIPTEFDLSQGDEEQFEFSDSARSTSARSSIAFSSFNDSKQIELPPSDRDDVSSCGSYLSEDEPTQYNVNQDEEEEEDTEKNHNKSEVTNTCLKHDDTQRTAERPEQTFSSQSTDSDSEQMQYTIKQKTKKGKGQEKSINEYNKLSSRSVTAERDTREKIKPMPRTKCRGVSLGRVSQIKNNLDIIAPFPASGSSSSDEIKDETTKHTKKQEHGDIYMGKWPALDLEHIPHIKRHLDIKALSPPPDSSPSSDSEDETTHHTDRPGTVDIEKFPLQKSQTTHHDPDAKWPVLNLEHIPDIKRRLDIKAPSPPPDSSSSSDSEDETTHHTDRPGMVDIAKFPLQKSQTTHHDPDAKWPVLNLEHIPHIKRRLDIKAPSPPPDSSSSSDSQDKTTGHKEKHISGLLLKESQTASHDSGTRWPALDLEHIPHIKRRLDIKAPSPPPDSSPSSDSEDETTHHTDRTVDIEKFPLQKSQTERHDPDAEWPVLNLEHIPHIKGRLDIKAPSPPPDSSSSSDREDETTHQAIRPGTVSNAKLPLQKSQTNLHDPDAKWPALDLENIPAIKRCLDIKAPSLNLDSFSSSESKDKATDHTKKQRPGVVKLNSCYSGNSSDEQDDISNSSINPDPRWPELGLSSVPMVKRRLDIKTYSPSTESSSSSNKSDSWTTDLSVKGGVGVTTHEQWTMMHKLNLGIPNISRRLDIKAPSAQPDLVLDSISEDYQQSGSNSSKRESEGENRDLNVEVGMGVSAISKAVEKELIRSPKTPVINISPYPKTDHNIKLEKYTVISDDRGGKQTNYNISTTPEINPELQSRWATMNLGISRFRKHLEITSNTHVPPNLLTSPSPDSPSSWSGESWTGNKCSRTRLTRRGDGMQEIHTDSSLTLENKPVNLPPTLKSRDQEDYSPPKITGFGTPYVRKYLDIRVSEKAPASPPLHQLPESSSSSESEGVSTESAGNRWRETSQQSVVQDGAAPQNDTSWFVARAVDVRLDESDSETEEVERKAGVELNSTTSEEEQRSDSMRPHRTLTNIPYVKRALDIRAPLQREFSSKSNREDETTDYRVPNLNFGVPRIKRRLDIKAPSPEPNYSSTSCSESGNEVIGYTGYQSREASNMSGMTDYDFQITYKRSILKGPLTLGNSLSPSPTTDRAEMFTAAQGLSHSVGDRNASPSPWTVPSDDIVKKRIEPQHTIDEEVPPEIRWTGIGRHLSDFPMSGPRRLETVVQASPAEAEPSPAVSSRMKSDDKLKQDRGRADVALMHAYSYPIASRVSPASSRAFDKFDNTSGSTNEIFRSLSADRFGKKGLGALKTMSSKTLQWDTEDKDIDAV